MQIEFSTIEAKTPEEARTLIESATAQIIDLGFPCTTKMLCELAKNSRKLGVIVRYRGQEMILVESFRALKRGLSEPKDTFRERHLICCFDISLAPAQEIADVQARAVELGDLILPEQVVTSPYAQWVN